MQLSGQQLIALFTQITEDRQAPTFSNTSLSHRKKACQCECSHDSPKMADIGERFVPPRLDL